MERVTGFGMSAHRSIKAWGRARIQIIDPRTGRICRDTGWMRNLILDQGLNGLAVRYWADSFTSAALGVSAAMPLKTSGGATLISQSNVTVTLAGGSFTFTPVVDVGKVVKFNSGYEVTLVEVLSASSATVNTSATVGAQTFNIYDVNQTGLQDEFVRSNDYATAPGNCGATMSAPNMVVLRRSFNFPLEASTTTYRELGLSWSSSPGNNLFTRIIFPTAVTVNAGMRARVVYDLTLTFTPAASSVVAAVIDGWPVAPATDTMAAQSLEDWGIASISSLGLTEPYRVVSGVPILANEPSVVPDYLVGTDTQALGSPGDLVKNRWAAGSYAAATLPYAYTTGAFNVVRTGVVPTGEANGSSIRVFSVGHIISPTDFLPVTTMLFDQAQTKSGTFFLGISFRLSWGRTIIESV